MFDDEYYKNLLNDEEALEKEWESIKDEIKLKDSDYEVSDDFKKRMNRLFREVVGGDHALCPEVDNIYERVRSKIIRFWFLLKERLK